MEVLRVAALIMLLGCSMLVNAGNYDDRGYDDFGRDGFDDGFFLGGGIGGIQQGGAVILPAAMPFPVQGGALSSRMAVGGVGGSVGGGAGAGIGAGLGGDLYFDRKMAMIGSGVGGLSRRTYGRRTAPRISGGLLGGGFPVVKSGYGGQSRIQGGLGGIGGGVGGLVRPISRSYGGRRVISGIGGSIGGLRRRLTKSY